jgi:predicted aspartyl protease
VTFEFDSWASIIEVQAAYSTGTGGAIFALRLALDTGATQTVINPTSLRQIPDFRERVEGGYNVETANGEVVTFGLRLPALFALGLMREEFTVIVHDIGSSLPSDGVIGLDFLRERELRINFRRGEIELN